MICKLLSEGLLYPNPLITTSISSALRPYAKTRYLNETKRLYGVLEIQLKDKPYLTGEKYTIADLKTFGWCVAFIDNLQASADI